MSLGPEDELIACSPNVSPRSDQSSRRREPRVASCRESPLSSRRWPGPLSSCSYCGSCCGLAGHPQRSAPHGLRTRQHGRPAVLATRGAPNGPGGILVIDSAERIVYCLGGRPHPIIITRPALNALEDDQLAAVIVHEHAHLSGHHHEMLGFLTALASALPWIRLFAAAVSEVTRLAEMSADDAAARRHGGDLVVAALVALATGARVPAQALGAAATDLPDRVERLLFPTSRRRVKRALGLNLAAVLFGPAVAAVLVITLSRLCLAVLS